MKNKLFGFFNYEGTRIKQGVSRVSTVPLPNERIGDFSPETAASLGLPAYPTIYDPTTGLPFPDNKIPAGRMDTAVSGLMNLFPLPNAPGDLNNYVRNALAQDNDDSYDGRIDFTLNSKNNFFGRYSYSNRFRFIPGYLGGIADGTSTSAWGRQFLKSYSFVLGYTHIFTPTLVNDFHFGWIRNYSYAEQDPFGKNAADEFVPGIPNNPAIAGGVPLTTFSNFGFIGSPDFLPKRQIPQQYQYSDTISWTHGAHSFKFGGTLWAPMRNIFQDEPGTRGDLGIYGSVHELRWRRWCGVPEEERPVLRGRFAGIDAEHAAYERVLRRSAVVDAGGVCGGRLEGDAEADAEPRIAVRLRDTGAGSEQPDGELRSGGRRLIGVRARAVR